MILIALLSVAGFVGWLMLRSRIEELEDRIGILERVETRRTCEQPQPPVQHDEQPPRDFVPLPQPAPVPKPQTDPPLSIPAAPEKPAPQKSKEWEALVGGNLLNKAGALVLVIGIALFLGYSFTHMSPGARVATCAVLSASLLGLGMSLETRLAVFARGLIGAGWAGLYATAYASHALDAARVIENPLVASVLLLVIAAGMVGHSLRYRAQAVTGVAFFTAFAALVAMPSSGLAVVSLLPLAAALLWFVRRMQWYALALPGMAATWITCFARTGASSSATGWDTVMLLAVWLLFEAFDLLRLSENLRDEWLTWIFPLNALCLTGLTYRVWTPAHADDLWRVSAFGAALFATDAALRFRLGGRIEAVLGVAAGLSALAITGRVHSVWQSCALAVEAQTLWWLGWRLNLRLVRGLGAGVFVVSLARLWFIDVPTAQKIDGIGLFTWTPPLLFHAALFWTNRVLAKRGLLFSCTAAALVAFCGAAEMPQRLIGLFWIIEAVALFETGVWRREIEFRVQAYVLAAAGAVAAALFSAGTLPALIAAFLALLAACLRLSRISDMLDTLEQQFVPVAASTASAATGTLLMWRLVPHEYAPIAWCTLSLALVELGVWRFAAVGPLVLGCVWAIATVAGAPVCVGCATAAAVLAIRTFREPMIALAAVTLAVAAWRGLPPDIVALAWLAEAVVLMLVARHWQLAYVALLGHVVAAVAVLRSAAYDRSESVIASVAMIAALYTIARWNPRYTLAATGLTSLLLWTHVSGGMLTIALGAQGMALMAGGFVARERTLRIEGLCLLLGCIVKLFVYDLRHLETLHRIGSFITLGVILLAVSWIYARFRERYF